MEQAPFDFICHHTLKDRKRCEGFVHRTFNGEDLSFFFKALQFIYTKKGGLEVFFSAYNKDFYLHRAIHDFKILFFSLPHIKRTEKHVADPLKNSAAKRINMFLRWMVRDSKKGVDFGIWKTISPSQLSLSLIHISEPTRPY